MRIKKTTIYEERVTGECVVTAKRGDRSIFISNSTGQMIYVSPENAINLSKALIEIALALGEEE